MEGSGSISNESKTMDISVKKNLSPFQPIVKKKRLRQQNSLGELTKNFIDFIVEKGDEIININDLVKKLHVKKRRIYDITNVLEGIGYIKKLQKNQIQWLKKEYFRSSKSSNYSNKCGLSDLADKINSQLTPSPYKYNKGKKSKNCEIEKFEELNEENKKLENFIKQVKIELKNLTENPENKSLSYVTIEDLKFLADNDKTNLIAVHAPVGSEIEFADKQISKDVFKSLQDSGMEDEKQQLNDTLKLENQMFVSSNQGEISVYLVCTRDEYDSQGTFHQLKFQNNCNIEDNFPQSKVPSNMISFNTGKIGKNEVNYIKQISLSSRNINTYFSN